MLPSSDSKLSRRLAIYWKTADRQAIINRFWSCVDKTPGQGRDGDCWRWTGDYHPADMSALFIVGTLDGKRIRVRAARWIYEQTKGPLGDLYTCHSCDWPLCVNPNHLEAGDQRKNMGDAGLRNRMPAGKQHHNCKLSIEDVASIMASAERHQDIAERFGVSYDYVRHLRAGRRRRKEQLPTPQVQG